MASVTFAIDDADKKQLSEFLWVNWSELGREKFVERMKKEQALSEIAKFTKGISLSDKNSRKLSLELKRSIARSYREE